ncbi:MAG: hypothetical protein JXX29_01660 [Deltaproteobacteria bacterium]|nr:hypothetical protein [Deltaproteobacteria bacterium]MBN2670346.1 hypothetical protein [Deltaproteobacteria bacterium]
MKKLSMIAAIAFLSLLCNVHAVVAQEAVTCKVLTIEATNSGNGVDSALQPYAAIFKKKPFDTFNSFALISEKEYTLKLNQPLQLSLPTQLTGTLEFRGNDKNNLKLQLHLTKNEGAPIVINGTASDGAPFMAAGYKSPLGRWVIAIKCNK